MFRVAVIFLTPETPPPAPIRPPVEATLSVGADLNAAAPVPAVEPQLFEVAIQVAYRVTPGASEPSQVSVVPGQPVAVGGQSVRVRGSGLTSADAAGVFLRIPGGASEWPVPVWRVLGTSASGTTGDADELVLSLPPLYGTLPAAGTALVATPMPAVFLLAVGNPATAFRSNSVPLTIAPRIDGIGPGQPVLAPDGTGVYAIAASGLVAAQTGLLLENTALTIGAAAAPGVAAVNVAAGTIAWMLPAPAGFASGSFVRVRVLVNAIEAP